MKTLTDLLAIMASLRDPQSGCAWDIKQDHVSLAPYALEEAYEVVDAIERGDKADLKDELGDLLLQVVYHACVAEEAGDFTFADVVDAIAEKMIRRHPHIFASFDPVALAVGRSWEEIKAAERAGKGREPDSRLAGVPLALPALTRAIKLQEKASRVGFDWHDARLVVAKIREELAECEAAMELDDALALQAEVGDLFFATANLARHLAIDPETAVRSANAKFVRRFRHIEIALAASGQDVEAADLDTMEALWVEAKKRGL